MNFNMDIWIYTEDLLPPVPPDKTGVPVWMTCYKNDEIFVIKGHYTDKDATGFRWWSHTSPLGVSDRGVESTFGGEVFAWKHVEPKPSPAVKRK